MAEFSSHYHGERNHQGKGNKLLFPDAGFNPYRAATALNVATDWATSRMNIFTLRAWGPTEKSRREALMLEAVKIAAEAGIDVNAANSNGRTALDGANSLGYESVVKFLVEKDAKFGRSSAGKPEPPEKSPEPSDK